MKLCSTFEDRCLQMKKINLDFSDCEYDFEACWKMSSSWVRHLLRFYSVSLNQELQSFICEDVDRVVSFQTLKTKLPSCLYCTRQAVGVLRLSTNHDLLGLFLVVSQPC